MSLPGTVFKIDKLTYNKWSTWSEEMKSVLLIADFWPAIDGDIANRVNATPPTATPPELALDRKAKALLLIHVSDELQPLVTKGETAKQAWDNLKSTFEGNLTARLLNIKQQWASLAQEPNETIFQYYSRADRLRSDLGTINVGCTKEDFLSQLILGLNANFATTREVLGLSDLTQITEPQVLAKLQWAENNNGTRRDDDQPVRMPTTYNVQGPELVCDRCKNRGHKAAECRTRNVTCTFCGKMGHEEFQCRKKHGNGGQQKSKESANVSDIPASVVANAVACDRLKRNRFIPSTAQPADVPDMYGATNWVQLEDIIKERFINGEPIETMPY